MMPQFDFYNAPSARPGDSQAMRDAIDWLNSRRIPFVRPTDHQLKIGDLSFYPNTGTIFRDGDPGAFK